MYMQKYLLDHKAFVIFEVDLLLLAWWNGHDVFGHGVREWVDVFVIILFFFFDPSAWLSRCWLIYQNIKDIFYLFNMLV